MTALGIILLVAAIAWGIAIGAVYLFRTDQQENARIKKIIKVNMAQIVGAICLFVFAIFMVISFTQVPAGHKGVMLWFGKVENRVINEGLTFKLPFAEQLVIIDVRVQAHEYQNIDAASKEMQSVKLSGNVNWRFDKTFVNTIYQTIGANTEFVNKILDKSLQDFLKEVTPKYGISEILPARPEIRSKAVEALTENLSRYHIIIDDIYIADIQFSPEYLSAIEKQQVAERQVNTEKNILEQKRIQAEQVKVEAEGKANALIQQANGERQYAITKAEGDAKAILTIAEAQASANEQVNKTLTESIINYTYVQKLSPNIKVIILPNGQQLILDSSVYNPN